MLYDILIDSEDLPALEGWNLSIDSTGYVRAYNRRTKEYTKLSRLLLKPTTVGTYVDHINGNKLDNRRCNLRLVSNTENQYNAKPHSDKASKLPKGVTKSKSNKNYPYQVRLSWEGNRMNIGYFKTVEEAEAAYIRAVELFHGRFAYHKCRKEV
jgi:hypothetical protein